MNLLKLNQVIIDQIKGQFHGGKSKSKPKNVEEI